VSIYRGRVVRAGTRVCHVVALVAAVAVLTALPSASASADVATLGEGDCQCTGVAADSTGAIYTADPETHQIVKLAPTGALLARWGTHGSGPGQFAKPEGLAVDRENNVYVAEVGEGSRGLQELSSADSYMQTFPVSGRAVAVDPSLNVYATSGTRLTSSMLAELYSRHGRLKTTAVPFLAN
jgi:streptogramin lyase